jgi:hypothetical protein
VPDVNTIALIDLAQRHVDEFFDEARILLRGGDGPDVADGAVVAAKTAPDGEGGGAWRPADAPPTGTWKATGKVDGESYRWPDGNVDVYEDFALFEGEGDFAGMKLALGRKDDGEVVGFLLGADGTAGKRGLVYFQTADDFDASGELVSMIRGGGANGRSGFSPDDPPPPIYGGSKIESLKSRKAGKWNVQALVAGHDDLDALLAHLAIQAKIRGLA